VNRVRRTPDVVGMPTMHTHDRFAAVSIPTGVGNPDHAHVPNPPLLARVLRGPVRRLRPRPVPRTTAAAPSRPVIGQADVAGANRWQSRLARRHRPGTGLVPSAAHPHRRTRQTRRHGAIRKTWIRTGSKTPSKPQRPPSPRYKQAISPATVTTRTPSNQPEAIRPLRHMASECTRVLQANAADY
jgi:hypothetical protein